MTNGNGSLIPTTTRRVARMRSKRSRRASCLLSLLSLSAGAALAQGPAPTPILSPSPSSLTLPAAAPLPELTLPHELTKADLEPFLAALLPAQLQRRDIAGAVVSVVKDGQVLFAKGYGYSDFATKKPVVAEKTL